jgi:hypothetical protein
MFGGHRASALIPSTIGNTTDLETRVGVVARFVGHDELLIITVYELD